MTDPITVGAIAGAVEPITKIVLGMRPKAWVERGKEAERKVTKLIFQHSALLPLEDYHLIARERYVVDTAREELSKSGWRKSGLVYGKLVYRYYKSANSLLVLTKGITEGAIRKYGPEGFLNAMVENRAFDDATPLAFFAYTPNHGVLHTGQNTFTVNWDNNTPQFAPAMFLPSASSSPMRFAPVFEANNNGPIIYVTSADEDDGLDRASIEAVVDASGWD